MRPGTTLREVGFIERTFERVATGPARPRMDAVIIRTVEGHDGFSSGVCRE